jgi:hypothetical protein
MEHVRPVQFVGAGGASAQASSSETPVGNTSGSNNKVIGVFLS